MIRRFLLLAILLCSVATGRASAQWQMDSQQIPANYGLWSDVDASRGTLYLTSGVEYWQVDVESGATRRQMFPPGSTFSPDILFGFHPGRDAFVFASKATVFDPATQSYVDSVRTGRISRLTGQVSRTTLPRRFPNSLLSTAAVLDVAHDRLLFWGGMLGDTVWTFSFGTGQWQSVGIGGVHPPALTNILAAFDPVHDRVLIYGQSATGTEVWTLGLGPVPVWSPVLYSGAPPLAIAGNLFIDTIENALVISGRHNPPGYGTHSPAVREVATLQLDSPNNPSWNVMRAWVAGQTIDDAENLYGTSVAFDASRGRIWSYGGYTPIFQSDGGVLRFDRSQQTLRLDLHGFSHWQANRIFGPPTLTDQAVARDPVTGRTFVVGSIPQTIPPYNGTSLYELSTQPSSAGAYLELTPPTTQLTMSLFRKHLLVDAPQRQLVLIARNPFTFSGMLMYTMPIDGPHVWTSVALPPGTPAMLDGMSVVTDPRTHAFIFFGGEQSNGTFSNETYVLTMDNGPHWTRVLGSAPSGRAGHVAVFDPMRERMIIFGGRGASGYRSDTWQLELTDTPSWTQTATIIPTGGFIPLAPRADAAGLWDASNHRLLVFGGRTPSTALGDFWQLEVDSEAPEWTAVAGTLPGARHSSAVLRDEASGSWWLAGGVDASGANVPEVWSFKDALSVVGVGPGPSATPSLALAAPRPNPARGSVTLAFSSPSGATGVLKIFDVRGRLVRSLPITGDVSASNRIVWDGRGESGRALPAGVYLCRLQAGGQSSTRRVTLLR